MASAQPQPPSRYEEAVHYFNSHLPNFSIQERTTLSSLLAKASVHSAKGSPHRHSPERASSYISVTMVLKPET